MKRIRLISLAASVFFTVSMVLTGCGAGGNKASTDKTAQGGTQKPAETQAKQESTPSAAAKEVKLTGYLPGDAQPGNADFMAEINKLLKKDVNATVDFKYIGWGDFFQKYPLILASGEEFDFAFIANWADFTGQAQKGAFMDITNLVEKNAPTVWKLADKDAWRATTIKGKILGIPTDGLTAFQMNGLLYREDLRKKYNIPEIKKTEDLEAYMSAIKNNEKDMKPAYMESVNNNYFFDYLFFEKTGYTCTGFQVTTGLPMYCGLAYGMKDPAAKLSLITQMPEFKATAELINKWYKLGFWNTSDMVNKEKTLDPASSKFGQGKAGIWRGNYGDYSNTIQYFEKDHPDWKVGFYYPKSPDGNIDKLDALQNGVAISPTSKNPERALMALDKILTVQDYKMLVAFGVKDKHYVLDKDGFPALPAGVDSTKAPFAAWSNAFSWFVYEGDTLPAKKNDSNRVRAEMKSAAKAGALLGFTLDTTNIKAEIAAVNDVLKQYEVPLAWGLTKKSIDEDIAVLNDKLKAAGIEKMQKEIQGQADQFVKGGAK